MNAKEAADLVKGRQVNKSNADVIYNALKSSPDYDFEFTMFMEWLERATAEDMQKMDAASKAAESIEKISGSINPLDENNAEFNDIRKKLNSIEFEDVEYDEDGNSKTNSSGLPKLSKISEQDQKEVVARIVEAAKVNTSTMLRGLNSEKTAENEKFLKAKTDEERQKIYSDTLKENIELALLQISLGKKTAEDFRKIHEEGSSKEDIAAKTKEYVDGLDESAKKKLDSWTKLGNPRANPLKLSVDQAIVYCAGTAVESKDALEEYKANIDEKYKFISSSISKLLKQKRSEGKNLQKTWNESRKKLTTIFDKCNKGMQSSINKLDETCKFLWKNRYEIAKTAWQNTKQYAKEHKYELMGDAAAVGVYGLSVATGGMAAVVGGAVYGGWTVYRRVILEARKQKKKEPEKSYKQIITNPKFMIKSAASIVAAGLSMEIALASANASGQAVGTIFGNLSKDMVATKWARRGATVGGSVASNLAGVIVNKENRKEEIKGLKRSVIIGIVSTAAGEFLFGHHGSSDAVENHPTADNLTQRGDSTQLGDSLTQRGDSTHLGDDLTQRGDSTQLDDSLTQRGDSTQLGDDTGTKPEMLDNQGKGVVDPDIVEYEAFPKEYSADMGITKNQFDTLRSWFEKLGDEDNMQRMYSHAGHYAAQLSVDADNPMTAEQVLFKFTRLVAITSVKKGEFGEIGTGSLGPQLLEIYKMLGCNEKMKIDFTEAAKVLDIATKTGRMDAEKFFEIRPDARGHIGVDEDGTLSMTRRIRVVGEGSGCGDKRVQYEEVPGAKPVVKEPEPVVEERPKLDPIEPIKPRLDIPEAAHPEPKLAPFPLTRAAEPEPGNAIFGANTNLTDTPGMEGVKALDNFKEDQPLDRGQFRAQKSMLDQARKAGAMDDDTYQATLRDLKARRR